MNRFLSCSAMLAALLLSGLASAASKPAIVHVHHWASAKSASWDGVAARLVKDDHPVIAVANPLSGLEYDADYVVEVLKSTTGPILLVGTHMVARPGAPPRMRKWSRDRPIG